VKENDGSTFKSFGPDETQRVVCHDCSVGGSPQQDRRLASWQRQTTVY
jgi:hypothetical protein